MNYLLPHFLLIVYPTLNGGKLLPPGSFETNHINSSTCTCIPECSPVAVVTSQCGASECVHALFCSGG